MADDEFDDDNIDWTAIDLPPASSPSAPQNVEAIHYSNTQTARQPTATIHNGYTSNESLQQQISHLQSLLHAKTTELQSASATKNRLHQIQEELVRTKREADQYKSQWVRVKKRVAELEGRGDGRAITPSNDHFHSHFGEVNEGKVKAGSKRKSEEHDIREKDEVIVVDVPTVEKFDSVRERVAKHLLLMDDMGCYSVRCDCADSGEDGVDATKNGTVGDKQQLLSAADSESTENQTEQETKSFVKSIVSHMVTGPTQEEENTRHTMSASGLLRALLERFNTLFYTCTDKQQDSMDVDHGHATQQTEQGAVITVICSRDNQVKYYTTNSWKAVLYLLHVLHDVLLLSGRARDDLRWWLYQARQTDDSTDSDMKETAAHHSRIEGLPSDHQCNSDCMETLWNGDCRHDVLNDGWDAFTMALPCNLFYEILVGLMKGLSFDLHDDNLADSTLARQVQMKSIELVSCLMSDAAYDNAENSRKKTLHLWKFWFDSLFPCYSSSDSALNSSHVGDFFSLWEKGDSHRSNLLGSGRRYYTQLLSTPIENEASTKESVGKPSPKSDKTTTSSMSTQQQYLKRMDSEIKCKSLELISHFISCSTLLHQSIYEMNKHKSTGEGVSLAKRVLFAVLDELDEYVIPSLSCRDTWNDNLDVEQCFDLCGSCVTFLLVLSRSDAGIHLLRMQTKLDFEIGEISRWSSSAIACVTRVMDAALLYISDSEGKQLALPEKADHVVKAKSITEQCILFYRNLLSFVHSEGRERTKSKASLLTLVSEQHNQFLSCCHRVLAIKSVGEEMKYETRLLLEEVLLGEDEA